MKITGGYLPRISGRPSGVVDEAALPDRLILSLHRRGCAYTPCVADGARVRFGEALARADWPGGTLDLPAPAAGRVVLKAGADGAVAQLELTDLDASRESPLHEPLRRDYTSAETLRAHLGASGLWPLLWSSQARGVPPLDGSDLPKWILLNCVAAEPFRTRGKVILRRDWTRITQGLAFMPRLMAEYGSISMILTDLGDPVVAMVKRDLAGQAWVRFDSVPILYPVENPDVLCRAFRRAHPESRKDTIWILDIQAMSAIGASLVEGRPLHERMVAVGGPGAANPCHVLTRIGTPLGHIAKADTTGGREVRLLRGGLFTGRPADPAGDGLGYDDDGLFLLPRAQEREFLGFVRPGTDRVAYLPCFLTALGRGSDSTLSTSLRGERRPCIACGLCESVCPAALLPQVLHRRLAHGAYDEAEALGLGLCVRCGLCSYVCPSKIELLEQFATAQDHVRAEREATAAARVEQDRREENRRCEQAVAETWQQ